MLVTAVAGSNNLDAQTVPAGQVWVILATEMSNATSAITAMSIQCYSPPYSIGLATINNPAAGTLLLWNGQVVLTTGMNMRGYFSGCNAGDALFLKILGYKMRVDL
jgi:hypothetical protein